MRDPGERGGMQNEGKRRGEKKNSKREEAGREGKSRLGD